MTTAACRTFDITRHIRAGKQARIAEKLNSGFLAEGMKVLFLGVPFATYELLTNIDGFSSASKLYVAVLIQAIILSPIYITYFLWRYLKKRIQVSQLIATSIGGFAGATSAFICIFAGVDEVLDRTPNWSVLVGTLIPNAYSAIFAFLWIKGALAALNSAIDWKKYGATRSSSTTLRGGSFLSLVSLPPAMKPGTGTKASVFIAGLVAYMLEGIGFDSSIGMGPLVAIRVSSSGFDNNISDIQNGLLANGITANRSFVELVLCLIAFLIFYLISKVAFGGANKIRNWIRHQIRININRHRQLDQRKPILFLRPFEDDAVESAQQTDIKEWLALSQLGKVRSIENYLVERYSIHGPVFAIGNPADSDIPPGASRQYIESASWQEVASELIEKSRAIIIFCSDSEGVMWELSRIVSLSALKRTVVFIHPKHARDKEFIERVFQTIGLPCGALNPLQKSDSAAIAALLSDGGDHRLFLSTSTEAEAYIAALNIGMMHALS